MRIPHLPWTSQGTEGSISQSARNRVTVLGYRRNHGVIKAASVTLISGPFYGPETGTAKVLRHCASQYCCSYFWAEMRPRNGGHVRCPKLVPKRPQVLASPSLSPYPLGQPVPRRRCPQMCALPNRASRCVPSFFAVRDVVIAKKKTECQNTDLEGHEPRLRSWRRVPRLPSASGMP